MALGLAGLFSPSSAGEYGGCVNPWFDVFTTFTETMLVKPKLYRISSIYFSTVGLAKCYS